MKSHRAPLLSGRLMYPWRRFALGLTLLLIALLALAGCGGDGSNEAAAPGDSGGNAPTVAGCDGEIFVEAPFTEPLLGV